jgi:hypothetical protein
MFARSFAFTALPILTMAADGVLSDVPRKQQ